MGSAFKVGQLVTWLYTPRGGYGYTMPIDARIVDAGMVRKTVTIEVQKKSGELVLRKVKPENLRPRGPR